ncbi:MFS transporter [Mesorhizobium dulcispinae]|uniref:MFS transporter n=1 Tax=Mesorhizobium dulcispinae TaxID=3072316 RepID=UPI002A2414AE|nr:MFS transporter [Mesorhizobium sp. VK23D]MDX8520185.1 MFS transporter [Mesorhizobium sp. VK23D]
MTLLLRVWLALTFVLAIVIAILAVLVKLQNEAVYSQLLRQRLSVIAAATAAPFRSVSELGLPIATIRNAEALLNRAWQSDPAISNIVLLDPSGKVVWSVSDEPVPFNTHQMARAMEEGSNDMWDLETATALVSGAGILDESNELSGALAVIYPMKELQSHNSLVSSQIRMAALALLAGFSALAYVALRYRLRPTIRALDDIARHAEDSSMVAARDFADLHATLVTGTAKYRVAMAKLTALMAADRGVDPPAGVQGADVISVPDCPTAIAVSRRLTLLIAALVLGTTASLGAVAYRSIDQSFAPELERRTRLIGSIANDAIARTLQAGVPFDTMVGGQDFFRSLLRDFPEISYFALVTNRPILAVGDRPPITTPAMLQAGTVVPIVVDGKAIANLVVIKNAGYLSREFRDVILDLLVVTLVTILLAVELVSVMTNHSLAGPLNRLDYILKLQAAGDFSQRILANGVSAVDRLSQALSLRAERLGAMMAVVRGLPDGNRAAQLEPDFIIPAGRPLIMRFCSLSDVRLPLFLIAAADSFSLSFFSLYVRDADNPMTLLNPGIVISLPLAAYLIAIVVGSPYARPLSRRFGHRNLFLLAAIPGALANLGYFISNNVVEIVFFSVLSGTGYAFASLSCQDYVIDAAPKEERGQALGLFHVALFGGFYAGTALGGVIADRLGERTVFLVCAALILISAAMITQMLPATSHVSAVAKPSDRARLGQLLEAMTDGKFATLLFGIILPQTILDQVFISYLLSLQMNALGASTADTGRMMMVYFLMVILSGSLYGRLPAGKISAVTITVAGALLGGVTLLAAAAMTSGWTMLAAAIGTGLGYGLVTGPQTATVMELAEGRLVHIGSEKIVGTVRVMERLGSVAGLIVIAGVAGTFGYSAGMGLIAVLVLAGVGTYFIYHVASPGLPIMDGRKA